MKKPEFPKDRIDLSYNSKGNSNFLSLLAIILMFFSIFIGAYGESVYWNPLIFVPIVFIVFLLSIYILAKCLK